MYNVYCDESCHLENDGFDVMVLGAISCPENIKKVIFSDIRSMKIKHGLSSWFEIKWTKISKSKVDFYLELVDYFFSNKHLQFRGVVATNKTQLNHKKYNKGSHNEWYYKMYYYLLAPMIDPTERYKVLIDIKDTLGGPKVRELKNVLCNNSYDFKKDSIRTISQINSKESEVLQLTDLFIGALSYYYRNIHLHENANGGKVELIKLLKKGYLIDLDRSTSLYEKKFNIFVWKPRED